MLYLEDYVELIEHLPSDLRDRFSDMRDMDLQIQGKMETLNNRVKDLFDKCTIRKGKYSGADQAYEEVRNEYYKVLESADEKVQMANQIYDLVDRHLRKLDQELSKFKMELEADNAGITEVLEQRSLELDNPVALQRGSGRERRRTHVTTQPSSSAPSSSTTSNVNNGDGLPPEKRIKLEPVPSIDSVNVNAQATDDITAPSDDKTFSQYLDPIVTVSSSDQYEPVEGISGVPKQSHSVSSALLDSDSVSTPEHIVRRSSTIKENSRSIEVPQRLSEFDGLSVDSVEIGGDHGSDSSFNFLGPAAQRPSRTKKQTTKAAAWVQERLQAEARHEQRKKESVPSTSSSQESGEETSGVEVMGESSSTADWNCDPNEPRYCLCNQVSYGEMVGCDNEKCTIEWFHYGCVGLTEAPKGKWYCPQCTQTMKRRKR